MNEDPTPSSDGGAPGRPGSGEDDVRTATIAPEEQPEGLSAVEVSDVRGGFGPLAYHELPLLFRIVDRAISVFLVVGFAVLLGVIAYNVFGRMFFGRGAAWADEGARFLFIWISFLGAAVAYFRREHIAVGFLFDRLPSPLKVPVAVLQELLVLAVLGLLMYGASVLIDVTFRASPLLGIPMTVIFYAVPVSAGLMALMSIYRISRLVITREV